MSSAPLSARVALVGPEFVRSENLGIRVLAAALRAEGHQPVIFPLTAPADFESAAQALVNDGSDVAGISISYEGSAWLLAAFPRRLRQLGFKGPIVAGGPFATLHAGDLLSAVRDLDGVIRHDGEVAIVRLAEVAIGRRELEDVPGIVLRGDGAPIEGARCDFSCVNMWPWRGPLGLPKHLGIPTADMIASRGCDRSCAYCSVAALRADANQRKSVLEEIGLGSSVRRRTVEDIVDEMSSLAFEYGARVFEFQDDTFLPEDSEDAVMFVQELHGQMQSRGMPRCGITVKLRADQVTREVCAELSRMGVIRAFVGIEALSRSMSRRIGRQTSSIPARVALGRLRRLGISTYFNSLAIGPEANLTNVEEEIEALATVRGVPFEVVRLVAYGGTALARRLRNEGRLRGCAFLRTYAYADGQVATLAESMARIATRHFGKRCPAKRVADLTYNIALARRFYARARLAPIERSAARLVSRVNADQVQAVSTLVALIRRGVEAQSSQVDSVVASAMRCDVELMHAIKEVASTLEREVQSAGAETPKAYFRGQVAAPLMASVIAIAGCGGNTTVEGAGGSGDADVTLDASSEAAADAPLDSFFDVDDSDTVIMDAPLDHDPDAELGCEELPATLCLDQHPPTEPGPTELISFKSQLMQPCGEYGYFKATVEVSDRACGHLLELVGASGPIDPSQSVFECVADLLANYNLSCFAGETVVFEDPGPMD